jgi:hypothetical protein
MRQKRKLLDASNPPTRKYRGNRHISRIYYNGEAPDAELNHCDGVADESDCTLVAETEAEPEVPVSFFPTKQSSYPYFHLKYPRSLKQYLEEFRAWCGPESSSNQGYDENSFDRFETVMKAHRLQHVLNKRAHADAHMEGDFVPDCEYKDSDSDSDSASSADESEREDEVAHLSRAVKSMSDVPRNLTSEDIELAASFHISKENVVAVGRYLPPVVLDLHDGDINSVPEHDAYVARVLSGAEAPKNQRMRFDDDDEDVVLSSTSSHLIPTLLSAAETVIHAPAKPIDDDLPVMPTLPAIDPTKVEQFLQSFEDDGDDEVDVQGAEEDECPTEYENESGSEVDQVEEDAHADNEEFMGESENSDAEFEDDDEELIGEYCSDPDHDNAPKEENNGPRINSHVTFSDSDSEVPVAIQSVPSSIKPAVESSGAPLASMGISDDDSSDDSDEDATFRARVRAATNPNNDTIQFPAMPALKFPAFPTALTKVSIADPVAALKSQESSISSEIKFNDDEDEEEESEEMRRVRLEIESKRSEIIERFSTGQTNAGKECLQVVIKSGADEVDLEYDQSFQEKMEKKYWGQRLKIFSLFDHGCLMDAVGWYSTTVERYRSGCHFLYFFYFQLIVFAVHQNRSSRSRTMLMRHHCRCILRQWW